MTALPRIALAGGWGYDNLGDEAILAGYIEFLRGIADVEVLSVDAKRTAAAQRDGGVIVSEYSRPSSLAIERLLVCGGGYLNGHWRTELPLKLLRLARISGRAERVAVHGVELRKLGSRFVRPNARRVLGAGPLAVRDVESQAVAAELGLSTPAVLPDAISLLAPHIQKYVHPVGVSAGKVLINVLDIGARPDASESEVDTTQWRQFCSDIVERLGDRALGLVAGEGDTKIPNELGLPTVTVSTVSALVSTIAEADAMLSVRMHPTLLGTILGIPTVGVPYTGKVRPTLRRVGVDDVLMDDLSVDAVMSRFESSSQGWASAWAGAYERNAAWLHASLDVPVGARA